MVAGTVLSNALGTAWAAFVSPPLQALVDGLVPVPEVASSLLWAVDSGLLAMLSVGIPFVLSFYLAIAVLEDSGYLASAAVLSDRVFNAFGLPGRAAIPMLAATGCNVPAIYGTRVLDTRRERLLAAFLIVLTPCSARSAVVIAALAPFVGVPAAIAAFGVVALVGIVAGVSANAIMPGRQSPLVLELPPLRMPIARQVLVKAWYRFRAFVTTAAPVMLVASLVLGLLYETGAIEPLQDATEPLMSGVLGLPPVAGIALVLAFLRKELALQLLVMLAIAEYGATAASLGSFMSHGQLFVYAVVTAVSIPCAATLATLVDEFGWRPALGICAATLGLALAVGAVLARLLGVV
jgi:ferrous iron transport protein B